MAVLPLLRPARDISAVPSDRGTGPGLPVIGRSGRSPVLRSAFGRVFDAL
jgi:hypothetical protein